MSSKYRRCKVSKPTSEKRQGFAEETSVDKLVKTFFQATPQMFQDTALRRVGVNTVEGVVDIIRKHISKRDHEKLLKLQRKAVEAHSGTIGMHTAAYTKAINVLHKFTSNTMISCLQVQLDEQIAGARAEHEAKLLENIRAMTEADTVPSVLLFRKELDVPEEMSATDMCSTICGLLHAYLTEREVAQMYVMHLDMVALVEQHRDVLKTAMNMLTIINHKSTATMHLTVAADNSSVIRCAFDLVQQLTLTLTRLIALANARRTGAMFQFSEGYGVGRNVTKIIASELELAGIPKEEAI